MTTEQRFIFCINSGRSGSQYLARVLDTAYRVRAFHEAEPRMIGSYLRMINDHPYEQTYATRKFKAEALRGHFTPADPTSRDFWRKRIAPWTFPRVYADTSHMFIKTFGDVVMKELDSVDVIVLRRPIAEVVRSFVELSYFGTSESWPDWMSSPNAATAAIKCIAPDAELDHFDKCIAYVIDIEARAVRFRNEYPRTRFHEITLAELNSSASVSKLFEDLRIEPTRATKRILGRAVNQKHGMKAAIASPTTTAECLERIQLYIARASELGIEIPASLKI